MIRTCDPLIRSVITSTASGYGSYDLITFVTGCSRQGVHSLPPIQTSFAVSLSQVCLNRKVQEVVHLRDVKPPRRFHIVPTALFHEWACVASGKDVFLSINGLSVASWLTFGRKEFFLWQPDGVNIERFNLRDCRSTVT